MHVRANQAYLETFGYDSFDDLLGLPLLDMIDAANADEMKALLRGQAHQGKFPAQLTLRARRADESRFDATVEFSPATFEGERCLQIVFRRQMVDPAVLEQLQRDPVTGLYNRQHMLARIDDAVTAAAKGRKGQSLLLIEPDNWAPLVSGIGLGKADELLAGFADRIRILLGTEDIAGMLAEHTFGVTLDSRSDEEIRDWIAKLQHSISSEIFDVGTRSLTVTASVGGSLLGEKNANTELLLNQASQALRNAQNLGGGNVERHDPAAREKADDERDKDWLALLRKAAVDRWVLERTINALRARDAQGQKTTYFVKLTATSLEDASLLPWLGAQMQKAALK